jgi:hypothetical protein
MTRPLYPNEGITDADRLTIHRAIGWLPDGRRITAEDWPTADYTTAALDAAKAAFSNQGNPTALDALADHIMHELGIDPERPFGCAIIVE